MNDPLQRWSGLASTLGPLELRVLEELWLRAGACTIRELMQRFPGVAYTTVMTTADRLFRKGLLVRELEGRAFRYHPRFTREELELHFAGSVMSRWLAADRRALKPLISLFVDEVSRRDESMLDELEQMIRRKRESGR